MKGSVADPVSVRMPHMPLYGACIQGCDQVWVQRCYQPTLPSSASMRRECNQHTLKCVCE